MNPEFNFAALMEFHRVFKREFYGWLYSNYECQLLAVDVANAYNAGGEL